MKKGMLHEYHVVYSVQYYSWFHVTAVGLGNIPRRYGGTPVLTSFLPPHTVWFLPNLTAAL
jgi:hypothetical protein